MTPLPTAIDLGGYASAGSKSLGFLIRVLTAAAIVTALAAGILGAGSISTVIAQEDAHCAVTDLGALGTEPGNGLKIEGRWSTQDCDSRFRSESDAHTFRFDVSTNGRIRIDLSSAEGDPYLYLLDTEGNRIADDDEGGAALDARIERDLPPGAYLVEATTAGGRSRGPAEFKLSIAYVSGCEPIDLGVLALGVDLTATGTWTPETCGSRIVVEHPAYTYFFHLAQDGHVSIDLTSVEGDPVASLLRIDGSVIGANDDGGGGRNARIAKFLAAGTYVVEATTYQDRGLQPLASNFELVIHVSDELERQQRANLKVEAIHVPDQVIAGEPFAVNYRVGNLGGGNLADTGGSALIYVSGPGARNWGDSILATESSWRAGDSYHSGVEAASNISTELAKVSPVELTLRRPGSSWVFVAIFTLDPFGRDQGYHGTWRNLTVLSGPTFESTRVQSDATTYQVTATADGDGRVTISVVDIAAPEAAVANPQRTQAIYSAGVRRLMLDGIFERPAIATLQEKTQSLSTATREPTGISNPAATTLRSAFVSDYLDAISRSGLDEGVAAGNMIGATAVENLMLDGATQASARYRSLAAEWQLLQRRSQAGGAITFAEALTVQSQLAYAENVLVPTVSAGLAVRAARASEFGWADPSVQEMVAKIAAGATCLGSGSALNSALATVDESGESISLDGEIRAVLPVFGLAVDSVLCALTDVDVANSRFLRSLTIADHEVTLLPGYKPSETASEPAPYNLRIVARVSAAGQVEHGVQLPNGRRILPTQRFLASDARIGVWYLSSPVEIDAESIGRIRSRRLADDRIEVGFQAEDGSQLLPDIRFLPPGTTVGAWLRSSQISVPPGMPSLT